MRCEIEWWLLLQFAMHSDSSLLQVRAASLCKLCRSYFCWIGVDLLFQRHSLAFFFAELLVVFRLVREVKALANDCSTDISVQLNKLMRRPFG